MPLCFPLQTLAFLVRAGGWSLPQLQRIADKA
jgi:hypothetical protein